MDLDFEKTLAMLNGDSTENIEITQLSEPDCAQIANALDLIFQGLSLRNWLAGGILRDAWQNALDQLREYVFSISINNAVVMFARQTVFDMRKTWTEKMRTAPRTNVLIQCPEDKRDEWANNAENKIQNGVDLLMQKINNFATGTPKTPKAVSANIPTFQQIFDSRIRDERQNVREREL